MTQAVAAAVFADVGGGGVVVALVMMVAESEKTEFVGLWRSNRWSAFERHSV